MRQSSSGSHIEDIFFHLVVGKDESGRLCETVSQGGVDVGGGDVVVHPSVCDSECDTVVRNTMSRVCPSSFGPLMRK